MRQIAVVPEVEVSIDEQVLSCVLQVVMRELRKLNEQLFLF